MMENNNSVSQKKIRRLFFWGFCLILFLPIIILPPTFQPSSWSRAMLFRIILTLLVCFLFFKFFYKKEVSFPIPKWKNSAYLPFLTLAAFFITLILATFFSEDIRFSIFGSPTRAGGVLNLLFFFIFACFLALFTDENNWKKLFHALFGAGFLASLLAVIQYFNILKNIFLSYEGGGTPSFLGNSTFLAIYMIFLVFLSFSFLIQEKEKRKKLFYLGLLCLFLFTILITGSRAAYLGLLAGFFFFIFFYPVRKLPEQFSNGVYSKIKTLKIIAASLLIITILTVLFFNLFPQIAEKNNLLKIAVNRLSIKNVATDLLGTRLSVWKIGFQMIKDKPLFGWGPENFYIGFDKYYDPAIPGIKSLWWDRPHNAFLDIAASSGIISLILYFLFWLILLWQLQRFKSRQGSNINTYMAHGLQAMFIGYLVALFFNFDD
ncbi:MAG: O-antigen ligase family protein, partial [Patescibacteria group bacterium]